MSICIPKEISQKLLKAVKSGEFTLQGLTEMKSSQRNEIFNKYTDPKMAQSINAMFEKAIISSNKKALAGWVERTLAPGGVKTPKYKNAMKKINDLNDAQLLKPELSDNFMGDIVAESLGISVSAEEAQVISDKATELERLSEERGEMPGYTIEYLKKRDEMLKYLHSLAPSSNLRILTSTIRRGGMLASVKSPLLNIISNTPQTMLELFTRRVAHGAFRGTNTKFALEWAKYAIKVYTKTNVDLTRATHIDDNFILGEDIPSSQGKGVIRKIGRFYEDYIFKALLSVPDVAYSAINFADSANIFSSKIAWGEGLKGTEAQARALEIFKDATLPSPTTNEGILVREQAKADAQYSTFQDDTYFSKTAMGIRTLLNNATGDIRLGDQLMPFVKTPANVIKVGLEFSGWGAIPALIKLPSAIKQAKNGNPKALRGSVRSLTRAGLGMTIAIILASAFDPDDYIGAYPTSEKERKLLELKNAKENSIRLGNKYISLDYFGAIASPLIGIMHARKYGSGMVDSAYQFLRGSASQVVKMPGVEQMTDVLKFVSSTADETKSEGSAQDKAKRIVGTAGVSITDYLSSSVIPAIVYDFGKAMDDYERKYNSKDPLEKIQSKIPFWRESLPEKTDVFGYPVQTEGPISTLLFGSRVKSAQQDYVTEEMSRLNETGNLPSLTDVEKTSSRVKDFKTQVDVDTYNEMVLDFKISFSDSIASVVDSDKYWNADDEKKASIINGIKSKILDKKLKQYGYYKPD